MSKSELTQSHILIIREALRCYLFQWLKDPLLDQSFDKLGFVFSNILRACLPERKDSPILNGEWVSEANWPTIDVPPRLEDPSGGPFDPLPMSALLNRTTMTVFVDPPVTKLLLAQSRGVSLVLDRFEPRKEVIGIPRIPPREFVVRRGIDQLTVVVIDASGTMVTLVPSMLERKLRVAAELATAFFEAAARDRPPAIYGFATFPDGGELELGLHLPEVPDLEARGRASIWRALADVSQSISQIPDAEELKKRIVLITDGEDEVSNERVQVCNFLLARNIVLDAIILANYCKETRDEEEESFLRSVCPLCNLTGGVAFLPETKQDALDWISREELVNLDLRRIERLRDPPALDRDFRLAETWRLPFGRMLPQPPFHQNDVLHPELPEPRDDRERRIAKEFRRCRQSIQAFGFDGRVDHWRVFIHARAAVWDLAVTFPADYPHDRPDFRFLALPHAPGVVSARGLVLSVPAFERYHPAMPVAVIIADIQDAIASGGDLWEPDELKKALNDNNQDVALPIPEIAYIRLLAPQNPEPGPADKPDVSNRSVAYSQITWKPVDERDRANVPDFVLARGEDTYFH
jgi:ubiquitin-protein ligase